jgi:hypothetical protein
MGMVMMVPMAIAQQVHTGKVKHARQRVKQQLLIYAIRKSDCSWPENASGMLN